MRELDDLLDEFVPLAHLFRQALGVGEQVGIAWLQAQRRHHHGIGSISGAQLPFQQQSHLAQSRRLGSRFMHDLRAADHDADHAFPFLVFAQQGQASIEAVMRLPIPGIGHEELQPGFHFVVSRLAAGLGTERGQGCEGFLQRGVHGNRDQAQLGAHQARVTVRKLRRQQEMRRPGLGRAQHALDQQGQVRIVGPIAHENERPLVIEAGDKGRRAGGTDLRRNLGGGQAERGGHVGATENLQEKPAVAVFQRASVGGKRRPAHYLGVVGQGGSPERVERGRDQAAPRRVGHGPDGIGHPNTFAIRIRQHVAQRAFVKQFAHQRQGRGQATLLQKIGKRGLVLFGSNPFEKALAECGPAGKLGQLGTASAGH